MLQYLTDHCRNYLAITYNGPAVIISKRYSTKHPGRSWYFSREIVPVQGEYGACFCHPGTIMIEHYECRGTSLLSGWKFLPVQYVLNGHWCGRGTSIMYMSYVQKRFAKTVTSLLNIPSVLCLGFYLI
jgi:hypothetical protein